MTTAFLVDATDVFNLVNRQAALNMPFLCPLFSTIPSNTYGASIRLFITDEDKLSCMTKGDSLTMAMHATAFTPLISHLY